MFQSRYFVPACGNSRCSWELSVLKIAVRGGRKPDYRLKNGHFRLCEDSDFWAVSRYCY
jgi:hypothetical protein